MTKENGFINIDQAVNFVTGQSFETTSVEGSLIGMEEQPGLRERLEDEFDGRGIIAVAVLGLADLLDKYLPPTLELTFSYLDPKTGEKQIFITNWTGAKKEQEILKEHLEGKPWNILIGGPKPWPVLFSKEPDRPRTGKRVKAKQKAVAVKQLKPAWGLT